MSENQSDISGEKGDSIEKEFIAEPLYKNTGAQQTANEDEINEAIVATKGENKITEAMKINESMGTTASESEIIQKNETVSYKENIEIVVDTVTDASTCTKEKENPNNSCNEENKTEKFQEAKVILTRLDSGPGVQPKLPVKRKLIEEELEETFDDSDNDATFKPSKNDLNSTDTETEDLKEQRKLTKKRKKDLKRVQNQRKKSKCKKQN